MPLSFNIEVQIKDKKVLRIRSVIIKNWNNVRKPLIWLKERGLVFVDTPRAIKNSAALDPRL